MHFGPRSEKLSHDIGQLELRLEDLETGKSLVEAIASAVKWSNASNASSLGMNFRTLDLRSWSGIAWGRLRLSE
jgi:hypothetical protein